MSPLLTFCRRQKQDCSSPTLNGTGSAGILPAEFFFRAAMQHAGRMPALPVRVHLSGADILSCAKPPIERMIRHSLQKMNRLSILLILATTHWHGLALAQTDSEADAAALLARLGKRDAGRVHDPSTIVKCKDEYWLFSTGAGINSWRSKDLQNWQAGPRVFTNLPAWRTNAVPGNRGHLWAPDLIHLTNRYLLYYSVSTFGKNTSAIGLATNPTLDPDDPGFAWTDQGIVVQSHSTNNFNAIDPAVTLDADGKLWLSFGSFWSGLKLIQLDPATGKRSAPDSPIYSLARQDAIEAPFIHRHSDHYYLFINWGICCRGKIGRASW